MIRPARELSSLTLASLALLDIHNEAQARQPLTHHVREATRSGEVPFVQHLRSDRVMQLDVVLPLSDPAGLDPLLQKIYDPASASYRHFLTPSEFTARFGPTQAQYDAAVNYLKDNGFTVVGGSRDGMDVQVKGTVSVIESAFHVTMGMYRHPIESRTFFGPDREPSTDLPFSLWHI